MKPYEKGRRRPKPLPILLIDAVVPPLKRWLRARENLAENRSARGDLGQRPLLPGHAIAGWGFKTSIVMLPVVMK
jgi:hypothetical protein